MFFTLFIVAIGGAIGSSLRFLFGHYLHYQIKTNSLLIDYASFPFVTFFINILGCFFAGIVFAIFNYHLQHPNLNTFFLAGILGGFTTFSAFSLDFLRLFLATQYWQAFIYAISSVFFSVLAMFAGYYFISKI
jgi:CrcB protein